MNSEEKIDLQLNDALHEIRMATLQRETRLAYSVTYYTDALLVRPADLANHVDTWA